MKCVFRNVHCIAIMLCLFVICSARDAEAQLVVVNTNDSGFGSLRQAILDANANPTSADAIAFNIPTSDPGFGAGVFTIEPLTPLPTVRNNTTIDGTTQTAFSGDTNPLGPEVVVSGRLVASGSGIVVSGDGSAVIGLVVNGFPGAGLALSRLPYDSTPSNNQLRGNYVGTDPTGTLAVPNGAGISMGGFGSPFAQARNNVVEDNLISGNLFDGMSLCDAADGLLVDNRIGTDRSGTTALGNGRYGINLTCAGAPRNLIHGNTIAFNGEDGVQDLPDYRFGVAFTPDGHQGNTVSSNSIHSNGGLGINLLPPPFPPTEPPSTVTPNDSCDPDAGGNRLQNSPVITSAVTSGGSTEIDGFLDSDPNRSFDVELFANSAADPSGFGEGETFLTTVSVATDSLCQGVFSVVVPALPPGTFVTATATDSAGNTSEFSAAREVTGGNQPPVADAGAAQTVAADDDCQAAIVLDGTGSFDPDGDPLTFSWSGPFGTLGGATPTVTLALGVHVVSLTVDDGNGGSDTDEVTVTVVDLTPPDILSVGASPEVLWPPNHKMRAVDLMVVALDACDAAAPACRLVSVSSNEPVNGAGDGDQAPDWEITGSLSADLRAERAGTGSGRLYSLAVECVDAAGNTAGAETGVAVPHNK